MKHRFIVASLVAPIVALAPVLLLGLYEAQSEPALINGEPDDAPIRAFGVFLVTLPITYVIFALLAALLGRLLLALGMASARRFLLASATLGLAVGIGLGLAASYPSRFGIQDALFGVVAFTATALTCVLPAAGAWWLLAAKPRSDA